MNQKPFRLFSVKMMLPGWEKWFLLWKNKKYHPLPCKGPCNFLHCTLRLQAQVPISASLGTAAENYIKCFWIVAQMHGKLAMLMCFFNTEYFLFQFHHKRVKRCGYPAFTVHLRNEIKGQMRRWELAALPHIQWHNVPRLLQKATCHLIPWRDTEIPSRGCCVVSLLVEVVVTPSWVLAHGVCA